MQPRFDAARRIQRGAFRYGGGPDLATKGGTMKTVSTNDSEPLRESNLIRSRLVAAAGSLLDYWTDFGRLIT